MRRVILEPGEVFSNKHLKRTGAFNAAALTAATAIIEDVRERGDAALRDYTERFDGVRLEDFRVPQLAVDEAAAYVDDDTARALRRARRWSRWSPWASTCRADARSIPPPCS